VRVSVVIPTYNRASRLPAAIDSVLRQGVSDIEIIVVDDGSSDDTRAVVARYGNRVRYVYQANAGVGAARNAGIRLATGTFAAFLDSDDRWHDFKLSMQLALFDARPDVGLVFSDFVIEKPDQSVQANGAALWAGRDLDFPDMQRITTAPATPPTVPWPGAGPGRCIASSSTSCQS
jgi:glycosyltransferase involved in cell wall biosynthesis